MVAKVQINPRKIASQKRSLRMVDTLLDATARILIKEGFGKASTNRIAEVAGVSVGSLYQYFPSKEAVVCALIDRHRQAIANTVREQLATALLLPLKQGVRELVTAAVAAHRVDPALHRALTEQIPRLGRPERSETFNRENYAYFRGYLERHRDEVRATDLELASFVCVTTIEALTHTAVLHHKIASAEATEALINEATSLVTGYLVG